MSADLNVNDYLEMVMLMIGWVVNNAVWTAMLHTGLAAIPFIAMIAADWYKIRQEGDHEGNKGALLLARIETKLYAMLMCYAFTCVPMMTLSFNPVNMVHREQAGSQSGQCRVAMIGQGQWGSTTMNSLAGQTAKIPLWWGLVHAVSKGVTNVAVSHIPCTPDLQAVTSEIDAQSITDPGLKREVGEFQQQCFGAARNMLFQKTRTIAPAQGQDVDWLGSKYFLETPGYYDAFYAARPVEGFPYNADRDQARSGTGPGRPGYPSCKEWWSGSNGLYRRLHDQVEPGLWDSIRSVFSSTDAEGEVIRRLISQRAGSANGNNSLAVTGYGNLDGGVVDNLGDTASLVAGTAGGAVAGIFGKAGMDMVKRALPMIQYVMIMAIVICLPFVMTLSGYSFKVTGTATFGLFSLWFLTFWWELARWLNANLINLIYNSDAAKISYLAAAENVRDKLVLVFVEWAMFLILPTLWISVLAWSGVKVGGALATSIGNGTNQAKNAGDKGTQIATKVMTKGK